jgi:arylsulfatase A-like enzyme
MVKMPAAGGVKPHRVQAPVAHLDIAPTLLSIAGIRPECRQDGISLLPMINGASGEDRDLVFECGTHVGINFACGIQSWTPDGRHDLYAYNASSEVDELYDLRDPDAANLAGSADHRAVRERMIERMGGILARDPRWLSYWSSFRLDHYQSLPKKSGDMQLRAR